MNVSCPECRSVFRVDPAKVVGVNLRARCAVCGGIIPVGASVRWSDDFSGNASGVVRQPEAARPPVKPAAPSAPAPQPVPPPAIPMQRVPAAVATAPAAHAAVAAPAQPAPKPAALPPRPAPTPSAVPSVAPSAAPSAAPPRAPAPTPAVAQVTYPRPTDTPAAARRPINPFLANDPNQKARRLARALVSDMIAYHPRKRDEGLRDGTLKQLFREEIKKSYEEYSEQVGREFAESTSHFQDALNEVLAGGKKVF
ncbi:MAG TPA: zinc-ribbon domain-containing protein [Gemmatimonadaceae bacterium]|nr:zinc-ribbon domain-containing protein [Gemmatimonadaceae bacterium]